MVAKNLKFWLPPCLPGVFLVLSLCVSSQLFPSLLTPTRWYTVVEVGWTDGFDFLRTDVRFSLASFTKDLLALEDHITNVAGNLSRLHITGPESTEYVSRDVVAMNQLHSMRGYLPVVIEGDSGSFLAKCGAAPENQIPIVTRSEDRVPFQRIMDDAGVKMQLSPSILAGGKRFSYRSRGVLDETLELNPDTVEWSMGYPVVKKFLTKALDPTDVGNQKLALGFPKDHAFEAEPKGPKILIPYKNPTYFATMLEKLEEGDTPADPTDAAEAAAMKRERLQDPGQLLVNSMLTSFFHHPGSNALLTAAWTNQTIKQLCAFEASLENALLDSSAKRLSDLVVLEKDLRLIGSSVRTLREAAVSIPGLASDSPVRFASRPTRNRSSELIKRLLMLITERPRAEAYFAHSKNERDLVLEILRLLAEERELLNDGMIMVNNQLCHTAPIHQRLSCLTPTQGLWRHIKFIPTASEDGEILASSEVVFSPDFKACGIPYHGKALLTHTPICCEQFYKAMYLKEEGAALWKSCPTYSLENAGPIAHVVNSRGARLQTQLSGDGEDDTAFWSLLGRGLGMFTMTVDHAPSADRIPANTTTPKVETPVSPLAGNSWRAVVIKAVIGGLGSLLCLATAYGLMLIFRRMRQRRPDPNLTPKPLRPLREVEIDPTPEESRLLGGSCIPPSKPKPKEPNHLGTCRLRPERPPLPVPPPTFEEAVIQPDCLTVTELLANPGVVDKLKALVEQEVKRSQLEKKGKVTFPQNDNLQGDDPRPSLSAPPPHRGSARMHRHQ